MQTGPKKKIKNPSLHFTSLHFNIHIYNMVEDMTILTIWLLTTTLVVVPYR
jgi:hypothetical protein